MARIKAFEIRSKNKAELRKTLEENRQELASLRVAQQTGQNQQKMAKIREVRRNIARVLTVINQTQKAALRKKYNDKKYRPLDLRAKKTRAIRRRLTKFEESRTTLRLRKRLAHFPQRNYAVVA